MKTFLLDTYKRTGLFALFLYLVGSTALVVATVWLFASHNAWLGVASGAFTFFCIAGSLWTGSLTSLFFHKKNINKMNQSERNIKLMIYDADSFNT
jgi:hypothetical protein